MALGAGMRLGRYEIRSKIGAGGMGEVFLAEDSRLHRKVALKVLPADLASNRDRMRRFVHEAKAASALNHPNILTIYEIEESHSTHFIATELIEGETLRQRLLRARMKLGEVLDVAIQTATALSAAHAAGIVHRDIKPENVMLRSDGIVKVLDFGLAKLVEQVPPEAVDTEAPTRAAINTEPGVVMGTAIYMSPEQARGLQVDARTDIFSLGVVLYEMVAGRLPFEGSTSSEVLASMLSEKEPQPLARYSRETPGELERIVSKALRKEREQRYQTTKDLLLDLESLKQQLDFEARLERSIPLETTVSKAQASVSGQASPTASIESLTSRRKLAIVSVFLVLVATVLGVLEVKYAGWRLSANKPAARFREFKVMRLTTAGDASSAAISPDGKYVAHVKGAAEQQSLWLRHIATGSDKEIVPSNGSVMYSLTFSPDGNHIYFIRKESGEIVLSEVPVLGNATKKLVTDIDSTVTFAPEGKRFAFIRGNPTASEASLIVANSDGTAEHKLVTHSINSFFWPTTASPAWSPDGERIAFVLRDSGKGSGYRDLMTVQVRDGAEKRFASPKWGGVEQISWLPDGSGLLFTASEEERGNSQIWYASYPDGSVRRITNDLNNYQNISLTSDGASLVTVLSEETSDIWVAPDADAGRAAQVTSNRLDGVFGMEWTPDGRIVHSSKVGGDIDVWIMNADGTENRQLTSNAGLNIRPTVTPNGRYILFMSSRAGSMSIWRMDIDGNNPKQLTHGAYDFYPVSTIDNEWVIFSSADTGKTRKVPIDGGNPVQFSEYSSRSSTVSPKDGRVAVRFLDEQAKPRRFRIALIGPEGGAPIKVLDLPEVGTLNTVRFGQVLGWILDGHAISYIDTKGSVSNIWSQPVDGGPRKQLTDFKSDLIFSYAWSHDGKKLALARGSRISDAVLISDITNVP
jgi:serine/threonine protein kinase/Tol biopolymer transport system component